MTRMPPEIIQSPHNSLIKRFRSLGSRKHRVAERAFVVEGSRGIETALELGFTPQELLLADDASAAMRSIANASGVSWRVAERRVFDAVMDTATPQGIAAIFEHPRYELPQPADPFVVLLDGVSDPGNVGTIIRTAAAAGLDAVILGPGSADPFSAKAVRSSMGSIFAVPVFNGSREIEQWTIGRCARRWLADGDGDHTYDEPIWRGGVAVIIGSEGHGPTEWGRGLASGSVRIPLAAGIESLNASIAAAVLAFEGRRQRARM